MKFEKKIGYRLKKFSGNLNLNLGNFWRRCVKSQNKSSERLKVKTLEL